MKKILISILFLAAVAAVATGIFFMKRKPAPSVSTERPAAGAAKETPMPSEKAAPPAPETSAPEAPPEQAPAPLKVRFEAQVPPQKGKPAPVTVLVESNPKGWPAEVGPGARLDLLLRLPVGVKLASEEGWSPAQLPPEERDDVTGPWSLYEKQVPLQIKLGIPPERLAAEKVELTVEEEGVNWIISVRARLTQDSQAWQAFGTVERYGTSFSSGMGSASRSARSATTGPSAGPPPMSTTSPVPLGSVTGRSPADASRSRTRRVVRYSR